MAPVVLADPFVFLSGNRAVAIGTGNKPGAGGDGRVFPSFSSENLIDWTPGPGVLESPDPSLGTDFWAPEVAFESGTYYLYYSVGFQDRSHQLRVATSADALGPYADVGQPVLDPRTCPFAIDPHPFRDADGSWYLFYARDFLDTDRPGTALAVSPLVGMTRIGAEFTAVARATQDWQRYQADRPMYGGVYDWHTLEGPAVCLHDGRYFCLYSGGNWQNRTYGVDYVVSDRILGPYGPDGDASNPRVLWTNEQGLIGPGHNSIFLDQAGNQRIAFHAWDAPTDSRVLHVADLEWASKGPRAAAPFIRAQLGAAPIPGT